MQRLMLRHCARTLVVSALLWCGPSTLNAHAAGLGDASKTTTAEPATAAPEYLLKAAFLYNFAQFTTWPERSDKLVHLCILGRDPFGSALDALAGKNAGDARIAIARLRNLDEAMRTCQIVFVTDAEVDTFVLHMAGAASRNGVLTIAERDGAARAGVMIELTLANNKVGFEFNQQSAEKNGVNISSKLLRLARKVY